MAKRGIRMKVSGRRSHVKPKSSSNSGGFYTKKIASIRKKQKVNNG